MPAGALDVELPGRVLVTALTVASLGLVLVSYFQDLVQYGWPEMAWPRIWRLDVDAEISVPTWFSSGLILVNAGLLGLMAVSALQHRSRWRWHWTLLAIGFVGLSLDEALALHEILSIPIKQGLGTSGLLHFAWVLPGVLACAAGFLAYLPFILALPAVQRVRLLVSAAVFLSGAVLIEMIGGAQAESQGLYNLTYRTLSTLEEALELLGMVLFLNFLLHQAATSIAAVRVRMEEPA